jgi:hypothetical protein
MIRGSSVEELKASQPVLVDFAFFTLTLVAQEVLLVFALLF